MGKETGIAWTEHTFNAFWGCTEASEACAFCYARTFAERYGWDIWGDDKERRHFKDKHWNEPLKWNEIARAEGRHHTVFTSSMADVYEDRRDLDADRERLFDLVERTPWLFWQMLTKRADKILELSPPRWRGGFPMNVWVGCTMENQARADQRWEHLRKVIAPVRFASCEPLLGPINIPAGLDWIIIGGESGPKRREMKIEWAEKIAADVRDPFFGSAVFVKQDAGLYSGQRGRFSDAMWALKQFPPGYKPPPPKPRDPLQVVP